MALTVARDVAELVAGDAVDLRRVGDGGVVRSPRGEVLQPVAQAGDAAVAERAQAVEHVLDAALDAARDQEGDAEAQDRGERDGAQQEEAGGRVGVLHVAAAGAGVALGGGAEQARAAQRGGDGGLLLAVEQGGRAVGVRPGEAPGPQEERVLALPRGLERAQLRGGGEAVETVEAGDAVADRRARLVDDPVRAGHGGLGARRERDVDRELLLAERALEVRGPARPLEVGRVEGLAVVGDVAQLRLADDAHDEHERDEEAGAPEELGADGEATGHVCPDGRPLALALEQPEDPADELALDLPAARAVEEVADAAARGRRCGRSPRRLRDLRHGDVLQLLLRLLRPLGLLRLRGGRLDAPAEDLPRALVVDRACRTSRTAARPSRRPRRRRPGPSATPGRAAARARRASGRPSR